MAVALSKIPALRELYRSSVLRGVTQSRFPPNPKLFDRISLFQGDITKLEIDAIVNAANSSLLGGGGVDGAIHRAAGPKLLEECQTHNGCRTGDAKITKGYNLPSKHVIHAVGPIYSQFRAETCAAQLASCYRTSLELAMNHNLKHVAFPSISTGIYGYPIRDATSVALGEVRRFLDNHADVFERIIFVVFSDADKQVYEELIPEYFPPDE